MAQIAHLVRVRAPQEQVFDRVATVEGIAEWFTEASSSDYREGGELELRFDDGAVAFQVTSLAPPSRVAWHCTTEGNPWFDTDIAFEFEARGDRTIVRFDHTGWPEVSDRFRDCSQSWAYFLESLRMLIEDGAGTPEKLAPPRESGGEGEGGA